MGIWSARSISRTDGDAAWVRTMAGKPHCGADMYSQEIRALIAQHARLPVDVATLSDDSDLYEAGLTSLSTVNLMLALEEHFDVEFLDRMLGRKTFGSIASLEAAIRELRGAGNTLSPTLSQGSGSVAAGGAA